MPLLLLLVGIGLVLLLHNRLYQAFLFRHFSYRCFFTKDEVSEGDEIELVEELTNAKLLPMPWLKTDFSTSKWLDFAGTRSVVTDRSRFVSSFFLLKSHQSLQRRWKVKCTRRGIFSVDTVIVVASDLFGREVQSHAFPVQIKLRVLPAAVSPASLPFAPSMPMGLSSLQRHLITDPFEFVGIREYTERDPMNRINWAATARTQKLMVRENAYTVSPRLAVALNIQSSPGELDAVLDEDSVENAIRLCAGIFAEVLSSDVPVRFFCNASLDGVHTVETNAGSGLSHMQELHRLLTELPLQNVREFSDFLWQIEDKLEGSDLLVVSACLSPKMSEFLSQQKHSLLLLTAPRGDAPLPTGCAVLELDRLFAPAASKGGAAG